MDGEGLGDFFKQIGKEAKNVGMKILNNQNRALELGANVGTAAASKNPKLIAATAPKSLNLYIKGTIYIGENSLNLFKKCFDFIIGMTWKN